MDRNTGKRIASMLVFILSFTLVVASAQAQQKNIILATTTSTQDSGLLDVLIPIFEKNAGYFVKTIAVGSGQAMAMGQKGEADVLLVHSPDAEKKFMAEGMESTGGSLCITTTLSLGPRKTHLNSKEQNQLRKRLRRLPLDNLSLCREGITPGPIQRKSRSGKLQASILKERNGISKQALEWDRP